MKYFIMTVWNWYRPLFISRVKDSVPTVFLRGLSYPSDCGSDSCWGSDNEVGVCLWFTVWHWLGGLILDEGSDTRVGVQTLTDWRTYDGRSYINGDVCLWFCVCDCNTGLTLILTKPRVLTNCRSNRICFTRTTVVLLSGATCLLNHYIKVVSNP